MTGPVVSRKLAFQIINSPRPLSLISAPQGYGKSILALQVYEQWHSQRLWVNVEHIDLNNLIDGDLLNELCQQLGLANLFEGPYQDSKQVVFSISNILNSIKTPLLVVLDGMKAGLPDQILEIVYELSSVMPNRHKVVVTTEPNTLKPNKKLLSLANIQIFSTSELKFTPSEITSLVPDRWRFSTGRSKLLNECESWPALVSYLFSIEKEGTSSIELETELLALVDYLLDSSLSAQALSFSTAIAESTMIDSSLIEAMHEDNQGYILELINAGFLVEASRVGSVTVYRWPTVVRKVVQNLPESKRASRFELFRLMAWADQTDRWSDALYFSLQLDTPHDIAMRLARTGRKIQEEGRTRLLRSAIRHLDNQIDLPESDLVELMYIDLAAHAMCDESVVREKIALAHQRLALLCDEIRSQFEVWIKSIEIQYSMRRFTLEDIESTAAFVAFRLELLPVYYRVQAISLLGELAVIQGDLPQAYSLFVEGACLSEEEGLPSSLLWHLHQQAQVQTLLGQTTLAANMRFSALQSAHSQHHEDLFSYECLLRAHCESLMNEIRLQEAEPFLVELENRVLFLSDEVALPIHLLRLGFHHLSCLIDNNYQSDIQETVTSVERGLLGDHHPHVRVRAERYLLNHWHLTEQVHCMTQWYERQSHIVDEPEGPDALIHIRNLVYAFAAAKRFDLELEKKWPEFDMVSMNRWLARWPNVAPLATYLLAMTADHLEEIQRHQCLSRSIGHFTQTNYLSEPLSYHPSWFEPIVNGLLPLQRYQATFVSRVNALSGTRTKFREMSNQHENASQWVHLGLSPREWQLLMRVSNGLTNESIADQLNLSVGTIKNQLTKIYRKLGVSGRAAATSRFKGVAEETVAG
jgi:ATP/maltotriose-dependent transcriptional regulator MalT